MLIVWDSFSGTPVRTFLNPHPDGIKCLDLSTDNRYLATLGNDEPQTISLWDWTDEKEDGPIVSLQFKYTQEFQNQHWVKFNPDNPHELASNGKLRVLFLNWQEGVSQFQYYSPRIEKKDFHEKKKATATKNELGRKKEQYVKNCHKNPKVLEDKLKAAEEKVVATAKIRAAAQEKLKAEYEKNKLELEKKST